MAVVDLKRINPRRRRPESQLSAEWHAARPLIWSGLLDLPASVHRKLDSIQLESNPRMADFARVVAAVDATLGTQGLRRYLLRSDELSEHSVSSNSALRALGWEGEDDGGTTTATLSYGRSHRRKRPIGRVVSARKPRVPRFRRSRVGEPVEPRNDRATETVDWSARMDRARTGGLDAVEGFTGGPCVSSHQLIGCILHLLVSRGLRGT